MRRGLLAGVVVGSMGLAAMAGVTPANGPATSLSPVGGALRAAPAGRPDAFSVTYFWENDGAYTKIYDPSDRNYTAGIGLSLQWAGEKMDRIGGAIPSIGGEFDPDRPGVTYAGGAMAMLKIYTPRELSDPRPIANDRPYAGWTYLGLMLQRADRGRATPTAEHLELDIGLLGPMSQAGYMQELVHDEFEQEEPRGWRHQVQNEVGVDLKYQRRWRYNVAQDENGMPIAQVLPYADATVGTVHINASAGAVFRYGVNLPDDFGPARQDWGRDYTSAQGGTSRGPTAYVFIRPAGQVVVHDTTLGDSFFQDNPVEVDPYPVVFEVQAGIAVQLFGHVLFQYSQTFNSLQYEGQPEWDSYGSLVVSGEWVW